MPAEANWKFIYGTSIVCGIGFTMSIFVSVLAFDPGHAQEMAKVGINRFYYFCNYGLYILYV